MHLVIELNKGTFEVTSEYAEDIAEKIVSEIVDFYADRDFRIPEVTGGTLYMDEEVLDLSKEELADLQKAIETGIEYEVRREYESVNR